MKFTRNEKIILVGAGLAIAIGSIEVYETVVKGRLDIVRDVEHRLTVNEQKLRALEHIECGRGDYAFCD